MYRTVVIEHRNQQYKVDIGLDGFGLAEITIYRVCEKKHWWNSTEKYFARTDFVYDPDETIEHYIRAVIDSKNKYNKEYDLLVQQINDIENIENNPVPTNH